MQPTKLNLQQIAILTGKSYQTVYTRVNRNKLKPVLRKSGTHYYDFNEVNHLFNIIEPIVQVKVTNTFYYEIYESKMNYDPTI
jgi:selenocysteine lyase/cysteine desulfurase